MEGEFEGLNFNGIKKLFNLQHSKSSILKAESEGRIPNAHRIPIGKTSRCQRVWDYHQICKIGEKYGFLKNPSTPSVVTIFSTKGGILKSTISLNIARLHALHNIKTILIDLDPQADSSRNLGLEIDEDHIEDLYEVDKLLGGISGLYDLKRGDVEIEDIIQETDLPTLHLIPATTELIPLMEILNSEVRREYWIKEFLVKPLVEMGYELIIFDLAPSWNIYTSNAIAATDLLVSPLETKIAHYRNHKSFIEHLNKFLKKMNLEKRLDTLFVPVKTSSTRKLSIQIKQYYYNNVPGCSLASIRESIVGEESVAKKLSVIEYAHNKSLTEDIRELLAEINTKICSQNSKEKIH